MLAQARPPGCSYVPSPLEFWSWSSYQAGQGTLVIQCYLSLRREGQRTKRLCPFPESIDFLGVSRASSMGGPLIRDKLTLGKVKGSSGCPFAPVIYRPFGFVLVGKETIVLLQMQPKCCMDGSGAEEAGRLNVSQPGHSSMVSVVLTPDLLVLWCVGRRHSTGRNAGWANPSLSAQQ